MIPEWQKRGYSVRLHFFRLSTAETAVERVAQRVREGGHNVPEDVIRRRMTKGWRNFREVYQPLVDRRVLYDSTGNAPITIGHGSRLTRPGGQLVAGKEPKLIYATEEHEEDSEP
jgi:predicted ABC-type ATPase